MTSVFQLVSVHRGIFTTKKHCVLLLKECLTFNFCLKFTISADTSLTNCHNIRPIFGLTKTLNELFSRFCLIHSAVTLFTRAKVDYNLLSEKISMLVVEVLNRF